MPFWSHCTHYQGYFHCQYMSSWNFGDVPAKRITSSHQNHRAGDLLLVLELSSSTQWGAPVLIHWAWTSLLKWECIAFSHLLCCAFLRYYLCSSALCLGCLTIIWSEKSTTPHFPPTLRPSPAKWDWDNPIGRPQILLRIVFPSLGIGIGSWNNLVGWSCWFFLGGISFSKLLISLDG